MQDPCPAAFACPETAVCPYNLWRNAGDIGGSWGSIFHNLQLMLPWLGEPSLSSFATDAFGGHDSRLYIVTPDAPPEGGSKEKAVGL